MKTIHKFEITNAPIDMPRMANLLHVGEQGGRLYVWAVVDTTAPTVKRHLYVAGTGMDAACIITDKYVGTAQMESGLVWHVFDSGET